MIKKIVTGLLVILALTAIFNLSKQISSAIQAGGRLDQSADELSALQQQNRKLKDQLTQASKYDFIEQIARNKLNMGKPGETVVVIPQSSIDNILGMEKKVIPVKLPNWQGWLNLIFH